ncbi:hypothetical protein BX600DRAFT_441899 [Xylariales sp. PMI_506]|nr:hypothetical protein BX600DRAFT_441899 [Xylariales sp. PMI_506]
MPPQSPPSPPTRAEASYLRRRAGTACNVCRGRKTKCDNQRPVCGFCAATGGQCRYNDESLDHSHLDRGSLMILQRIGELEQSFTKLITDAYGSSNHHVVPPGLDSRSRPFLARPTLPDLMEDQHSSPQASGQRSNSQMSAALSSESRSGVGDTPPSARIIYASTEMTVESLFTWPVFCGGQGDEPYPPLISLLAQAKWDQRGSTSSNDDDINFEPHTISQLVDNFLSSNHVKNPIFDVDSLWGDVKEVTKHGLAWDGKTCLILLICAVSILSLPFPAELSPGPSKQPHRLEQADRFFRAAQKRIGLVHHENSLSGLQCSFLTSVYLMSSLNIFAAWKSFSQAGTQCIGWLAAHGRVQGFEGNLPPTGADGYVAESLYWSCLKSELFDTPSFNPCREQHGGVSAWTELRTEIGLPGSSLNEMNYPHVYPSPPRSMPDAWSRATEVTDRTQAELETGWFFYLAEIALRRMMNDALSLRYRASSWYLNTDWWTRKDEHYLVDYVEEFMVNLRSWYDTLPPPMAFPEDPSQPVEDMLRGILRGHLIDIKEVVYFPALRALIFQPMDTLGHQTLHLARQALENDLARISICQEGLWIRHQGTWLMIRSCTRSCLHLLAVVFRATNERVIRALLPGGWKEAVASILQLIDYWKDESPDLEFLYKHLARLYDRAISISLS